MKYLPWLFLACLLGGCACCQTAERNGAAQQTAAEGDLSLGNFSVSLAVKDIAASSAFYEKLGFRAIGGDQSQNWLIMQNDTTTIGLFQGMFEDNIMTFNPGWNRKSETLTEFDDVREIQRELRGRGIPFVLEADESTTGPASLMIQDPDGNMILIDQHVPKPQK